MRFLRCGWMGLLLLLDRWRWLGRPAGGAGRSTPVRRPFGLPCGARLSRGLARTRFAQTIASPDPRKAALLSDAQGIARPAPPVGLGGRATIALAGKRCTTVASTSVGGRPAGGRRLRSFGLRCCSSRKAGSAQTRFAQTCAALIRLSLRCSPQPDSRPQAYRPPTWTRRLCISFRRAQSWRATKPGRRCGPCDPLCAAEERSLSRIRARPCLSAASLGGTPRQASTARQPRSGRRTGVVRSAPPAGRPTHSPLS